MILRQKLRPYITYKTLKFGGCKNIVWRSFNTDNNRDKKSSEIESNAKKVTIYGAGVNIFLAISKGIVGYMTGSTALTADAAHSK
jgi:hypothetical protein